MDICILPRPVLDLAGLLRHSTCLSRHVRSREKPVEIEPHCSLFCPIRSGIVLTHGLFGWPYNTLCYPRYRRSKIYSHLYLPLYLCTLKSVNKLSTWTVVAISQKNKKFPQMATDAPFYWNVLRQFKRSFVQARSTNIIDCHISAISIS